MTDIVAVLNGRNTVSAAKVDMPVMLDALPIARNAMVGFWDQ